MKKTRLSHTSVQKYLSCSLCYKLYYIDGVRPIARKSALEFGGALDEALNHLLLTKNLEGAQGIFYHKWHKLVDAEVTYSKSDVDEELIRYFEPKWDGEKAGWFSLYLKGKMFINAYNDEVLPKIKKVIAVQEPISIVNADGDEIYGGLDLIVEWINNKTYLMDNKSSSVPYADDSAKTSQQLPLYYFAVREKFKLDGIGYIVLYKKINKNRVKTCKKCGIVNQSSHKTCNEGSGKNRCHGEFDITINPTVDIQYVFNNVEESDIDRVIADFDYANHGITHEIFAEEHNPVRGKYGYCDLKDYYPGHPDFKIVGKRS